ncbi:MAG TPA: histidine phosphatase family protein [Anaerolineales bacterium]|nr:histidine phosphatase family protein [Anaerolineales bacterium]
MLKSLLILRHAKSSWDEPGLADIDRPLNKRGKRDAPHIGFLLREEGIVPDLILCSPALRARKTAEAVAENCGFEGEIEIQDSFYPGHPADYLEVVGHLPDQYLCVMVVGHNPGLEELLTTLTDESVALPTAALAQISLPIHTWRDLTDEVTGKLVNLWLVKRSI